MLKKKKKLLSRAADFVQSQKHERKYNKMNKDDVRSRGIL